MRVEMWSDLTCPFSYIGKRLFEEALEKFSYREHVHVTYRSYILSEQSVAIEFMAIVDQLLVDWDCTNKKEKVNELQAYADRFGMNDLFTKGRQRIDTLDAHRLVKFAATQHKGKQMLDLLEDAYFIHNKPITEHACLSSLGEEIGLRTADVQEVLASCMFTSDVRADVWQASEIGVEHTPYIVLNETYGIPTLHRPDDYAFILHEIWKEQGPAKRKKDPCATTYCTGDSCEESTS